MSIIVNTNVQSLFAQKALGSNTFNLQKSIEKLSTGFRINRAGDDAAGLSISETLTAQIRGAEKAKQNIGDAISMVQTAEGGLAVIQENLQRIRELFVQASNGTNGTEEYNALQREVNERVGTIEDIANATEFNDNELLIGGTTKTIQVGADDGQTMSIVFTPGGSNTGIDINIDDTGAAAGQLGEGATNMTLAKFRISGSDIGSEDGTTSDAGDLADLDVMLDNVSRMRSYLGAVQNSLESRSEYLDVSIENNSASRSRIRDVDVASESSNMLRSQILQQSSAAMLSQANATPQLALSLLP